MRDSGRRETSRGLAGREVEVTIGQGGRVTEDLVQVFDLEEIEAFVNLVERLARCQEFQQLLGAESVAADARLPAKLPELHGQPVETGDSFSHRLSLRGTSGPLGHGSSGEFWAVVAAKYGGYPYRAVPHCRTDVVSAAGFRENTRRSRTLRIKQ